jgi:DNA mismatch repair protein MSH4
MVKNLSARDPSALGLDTYCKQYYLCLAAASATIRWYVCSTRHDNIRVQFLRFYPVQE